MKIIRKFIYDEKTFNIMLRDGTVLPIKKSPVISEPPQGMCKVINMWVDPITKKFTLEYDDNIPNERR